MKMISSALALGFLGLSACAPVPPTQNLNPTDDQMTILEPGSGAQCKIEDWQPYVGKTRQSLPAAPSGLVFRVLCKDCMATMDYRSDRVTFTYDDADVITRVACG